MDRFDTLGVMIDMSRNAVMSMDGLKRFLPLLAQMGYNTVFLYTEDTYEIEGEPYFGYMRGRYTKDELKTLDAFAEDLGIELIPCIQTLAHLNATLRWNIFPTDFHDIMMVGDERCYELIDRMFASCAECFKSRRIHIGMDEAFNLGKGKYLDQHGLRPRQEIMKEHLSRVLEIGKKYDFKPMIWSDMLFRSWSANKYRIERTEIPQEYLDILPPEVTPVYWDYYQTEEKPYDDMLYNHEQFSHDTWFAGGVWTWFGITPMNAYSIRTMVPAIDACRKHGVKNIFFTMWGDNGGECSRFTVLPALYYLAEYAKGNRDEAAIKNGFKELIGLDFDSFMALDKPNRFDLGQPADNKNPSKYMLYSDCFNGYLDWTVERGRGKLYGEYARELAQTAKQSRRYGYIFDTLAKLCAVLEFKYELGVKTREAYQAGDRAELRRLAERDYTEVIRRVRAFAKAFEKQWYLENKPQGFDIQDIRLGGLLRRLEHCRRDLLNYVHGKTEAIPELEEKLLPYGEQGERTIVNGVLQSMTVSTW